MTRFLIILICSTMIAGAAQADRRCSVAMTEWQPRAKVAELAAETGWTVRRIRIDDGCYQIIGTDAKGKKIVVKINPATLEIVQSGSEDDEGHRIPHDDDDD